MNVIPLTGQHGIFIINVFTVPPGNQRALAEAIKAGGHDAAIPGLLSRHLLCSADGTQVAHCMHWASEGAFTQAVSTTPLIAQVKQQVHKLGARPAPYELNPE